MVKQIFFLFSLTGLLLLSPSLKAQMPQSFSRDSIKYLEQVTKALNHTQHKKESKNFTATFPSYWLNPTLTPKQRKHIYEISNLLLKKKARPYPDLYNYMNTLLLFYQQQRTAQDYNNWEKGMQQLIGNPKIKLSTINKYLIQTQLLLGENIIYKSHSTLWKSSNNNFHYNFKNGISIVFDKTTLTCYAQRDSSRIINTRGAYYPQSNLWKGTTGIITWERANNDPKKVFAKFNSYQIDLSHSSFDIDTVTYYNPNFFTNSLQGSLKEKVMHVSNPSKAIYPRFESFHKRIQIKELYPHVDYNGGVAIHGAKFIGRGTPKEQAQIFISRNDSLLLKASSLYFTIKKDHIIGINTQVTIMLDTAEIYHPGLLFKYLPEKKEINLVRNNEGMAKSPYFNNYHKVLMDFQLLTWKLNDNIIHFGMMKGPTHRMAKFESVNYFSQRRYQRIKGMDKIHPLVGLGQYSEFTYAKTFTALEYANHIKKPINQVRQELIQLSFMGFLLYNPKTDEITIRKRLKDYIKSSIGRQDYDVISFNSSTEASKDNATLNMSKYNLKINGVDQIAVSNTKNVIIYPKNQEVTLGKNRDFKFDGKITAGLFDMYGNDFFFSYDNFKVDLSSIDSMRISVLTDEQNSLDKNKSIPISNVIENISGDLLIDDPNNKSGIRKLTQYPIFNSTDSSFVYYDRQSIQNGAYKRKKFFFQLDPYTLENINSLKKEDLKLSGTFVSDSIFPDLKETLSLQKDLSLGFDTQTPPQGYGVYGKGTYFHNINLSNKGLRGEGTLNYLSSTTSSKNFLFLPKSMMANADQFHLSEKQEPFSQPEVLAKSAKIKWLPGKEKFTVKSGKTPLQMYHQQAKLSGTLTLNPKAVYGLGKLTFASSQMSSNNYTFTQEIINADTSDFQLHGENPQELTFQTYGVKSKINLTHRKGEFISTQTNSISRFPFNQYLCHMNNFTWDMDNNYIDFGLNNPELLTQAWDQNKMSELPLSAHNTFISTNIKQDSFQFETPYARYNLNERTIKAKYVKNINVADALIFPKDGQVNIEPNALLQTIRDAKIIADTLNQQHHIFDALVNIQGRNSFSGSGKYLYTDINKRNQTIFLDMIDVDTTGQTYATGQLTPELGFTLSPDFKFKGDVKLNAKSTHLFFNGATSINNSCSKPDSHWLHFAAEVDPNNIMIPVDSVPVDDKQEHIFNGLFLTNDSTRIYSAFLSKRDFYSDNVLLKAQGYLTFNKQKREYQIASKQKLNNLQLPGNILTLEQEGCKLLGEGMINLGSTLGAIQQISIGSIEQDLNNNIITVDMMWGLDFFLSDQALKIMKETFKTASLKPNSSDPKLFTKRLVELIGPKKAQKAIMQMNPSGIFKNLPSEITHTLFFDHLKMQWNPETQSYQSVGPLSLGNINKTQINKEVKGQIELQKRRSGNRLSIYFELDKSTWFFFEYHHGVMFVLSSLDKYNQIIHQLKPEKRTLKKSQTHTKETYSFILSPKSKLTRFKHQFNL